MRMPRVDPAGLAGSTERLLLMMPREEREREEEAEVAAG